MIERQLNPSSVESGRSAGAELPAVQSRHTLEAEFIYERAIKVRDALQGLLSGNPSPASGRLGFLGRPQQWVSTQEAIAVLSAELDNFYGLSDPNVDFYAGQGGKSLKATFLEISERALGLIRGSSVDGRMSAGAFQMNNLHIIDLKQGMNVLALTALAIKEREEKRLPPRAQ